MSEPEQQVLLVGILEQIAQAYHAQPDNLRRDVILAQVDLLLTYTDRCYQRQFRTRQATNHQLLGRLEELLTCISAATGYPPRKCRALVP